MRHQNELHMPHQFAALVIAAVMLLGIAPAAGAAYGFTPYGALNNNADTDKGQDYNPVVATDGAGTWISVWQSNDKWGSTIGNDGDVFYAVTTNNGITWSTPAPLNSNATSDSMNDPEPVIATDGSGHWITVWASQEDLGGAIGTDWDILYAVSSNNGTTWSDPHALNSNAAADSNSDLSPCVASDRSGHWVVAWHTFDTLGGTIGNDGDIAVAKSDDNGATWTAPTALNTNAGSDTGMDSSPCIVSDAAGTWLAAWQVSDASGGTYGSDSDVLFARSSDNGATWTAPSPLNNDAASDSSDDFAVNVATDSSGDWMACWTSYVLTSEWEINIRHSVSTDDGVTWANPSFLTTDGVNESSNEHPSIAADASGTWMVVWQAWRGLGNTLGKDGDILISLSKNSGASWTPPICLKLNAPVDDGNDWDPKIATDNNGHWMVVWDSKDTLGDTIGKDSDILVSTTVYPQPIQVLKPNGGETFVRGEKKKVTWSTELDPGTFVRIEVWRDGSFVRRAEKSTPNDGAYKLKFPIDAETGGGYTMRVILVSDPDVYDESDAPFKVK